ncbi:hypothetical protein MNBD_IGNAVI01-1371 [hydrothermal vent metagenome]|uniref:Lipoprotein n=1 Tax=hydrothermal vent metagenome TaxID=652676 RepID=A0A3B1CNU2_9ZZZZ
MKTLFKFFPIFLLVLTLTGCIDVQYKMNLKTDGSGTIEEIVYMNSAMIQMLKGFMAMGNDSTQQKEFSLFDEDELRKEAKDLGKGVRYVSGEELKDNGREGYRAVFEFDDVNKIKMNEDVSNKTPSMGEEETPEDDITFKFIKGSPATLMIYMPEDDEGENEVEGQNEAAEGNEVESDSNSIQDEEWTDEMKNMMKDFRISIQIELDGDIVETNATNVDGSNITLLEVSFNKLLEDPEKFKKLKGLDDASYEETKELLKDIPGVKLEMNEEVKVVFE